MAMRELVTGGAACAVPGSSSSSNPFGALANALVGSSSKTQERLQEIPTSTPTTSEPNFYAETSNHLGALPGSEFDQPFLPSNAQGSEFLRGFRSAGQNGFADAWDEIQQQSQGPPFDHFYGQGPQGSVPQLQPNLDGPPQRVLSTFLHSFVESSRAGIPFRPAALPLLGLSEGDKQCIRDRSSIMARHFFADKSEDFINAQVNALLSSLEIDSDARAKGPLPGRFREMEDYWNDSQGMIQPGPPADGWLAEYSQHRAAHSDPDAWAHSFEQQHGANGWASDFEREQVLLTSGDKMRGGNISNLAAMEQTRMLAHTLAQNDDPKFQNSRFLQFVSKMSRGELLIDNNQVKPATAAPGDWASEYQQQYNNGPAWADEVAHDALSHGPEGWANEFATEQEQHGSIDDQWVNEFSKMHVGEWVEEFGQQFGEGAVGETSGDSWANAYDE